MTQTPGAETATPETPLSLAQRQPVAVRGAATLVATAVLHVLVVYGVLDGEGADAVGQVIDAVGALALILWVIPSVTPGAKVISRVTNDGHVVAGDAAAQPTGDQLIVREGVSPPLKVVPGLLAEDAA